MSVNKILKGWKNFIVKSEVTEELAVQRALNCVDCVELKKGGLLSFLNDDLKEIQGHYCNICKCPLSAKLRSLNEKCPLNKF
jgi:hypothetical protein